MPKLKSYYPKTAKQALKWIVENEHFEGYHAKRKVPKGAETDGLVLRNDEKDMFIPRGLIPMDAMKPSNWDETKRMFEPTEVGHSILNGTYVAPSAEGAAA